MQLEKSFSSYTANSRGFRVFLLGNFCIKICLLAYLAQIRRFYERSRKASNLIEFDSFCLFCCFRFYVDAVKNA